MNAEDTSKATGPVAFLPLLFGCAAFLLCAIYQTQRTGVFLHSFYSFDRFIQHHLDAFSGFASLAGILGLLLGLLILRLRGRRRIVTYGTVASLIGLLWSVFGLSL
jgi:hypothetical protein